ncbi:hypothetical protein GF314_13465, partial [bacterium]|nr:hypothetical protein [bacterium]
GDGGGVLVRGIADRMVDVTVEHSDFVDNYNDQGAGLYIGRFTSGLVRYCRFHGNRTYTSGGATFKGGGLPDNLGETAVYRFCEFIGNEAGVTRSGASAWSYAKGGAFSTRHRTRAVFEHCTFVANRVRGVLPWGDAIGLTAEGEDFDSDLERCEMVNCAFWGTDGDDVQVRSDAEGFSRVENCAWPVGEFSASGVDPVATVTLDAFPFTTIDQPIPLADAPLVDAGLDLGLTPDLKGDPVPQGLAPDIGAYEVLDDVSDAPATTRAGRLAAHPNPFNPITRISCDLPAPGPATLEILDLRGRRITVLHAGPLAAGRHAWSWNGRDDRGRLVPGGAYLARIVSSGWTAAHKLMLVK